MNVKVNLPGGRQHRVKTGFGKLIVLSILVVWLIFTLPFALVTWLFTGRTWVQRKHYEPPPWAAAAALGLIAVLLIVCF